MGERTYAESFATSASPGTQCDHRPDHRVLRRRSPGSRPGFAESAYARAVALELDADRINHERERRFEVTYRGRVVGAYRVDFLVDGKVVLELKSVERVERVHAAQALAYLRITKCRLALIVNFNVDVLKDGIRRVVL